MERPRPSVDGRWGFRPDAALAEVTVMSSRLLDDIRAEALFVTSLQRSDSPSTDQVRAAVGQALRQYGSGRNCAALVAAEFGEHPETAVMRMRWALDVVHEAYPDANQHAAARFGAA